MRVDVEVPVSAKPSEALTRVIRDAATTGAKLPKAVPIRCRCISIVLPSRAVISVRHLLQPIDRLAIECS